MNQKHRKMGLVITASALLGMGAAEAAVVMNFVENGGNVVLTASGIANTTGFGSAGGGYASSVVNAGAASVISAGAAAPGFALLNFYTGITGPTSFGSGGAVPADVSSGDLVGTSGGALLLPVGYTSGTPLFGTSTWLGATFTSLGLTPGDYVYSWGSGDSADTLTVRIGEVAAVPEPASALATAALLGGGLLLRRRSRGRTRA